MDTLLERRKTLVFFSNGDNKAGGTNFIHHLIPLSILYITVT